MAFRGQNYFNFGHIDFDAKGKWDNVEKVLHTLWRVVEMGYFKRKWQRPFYDSTKIHQRSPQTIKAHKLYIVGQPFHISGSTPPHDATISITVISCETRGSCSRRLIRVSMLTCLRKSPGQKSYKIAELLPWWSSTGVILSSETRGGTWWGFLGWVLILGFWCRVSLKLDLSRNRYNFLHLNGQVKWLIITIKKIVNFKKF